MKKGLTLIELLVFLAIIGILASILIGIAGNKVEKEVEKINDVQSENCYKLNGEEICSHL